MVRPWGARELRMKKCSPRAVHPGGGGGARGAVAESRWVRLGIFPPGEVMDTMWKIRQFGNKISIETGSKKPETEVRD